MAPASARRLVVAPLLLAVVASSGVVAPALVDDDECATTSAGGDAAACAWSAVQLRSARGSRATALGRDLGRGPAEAKCGEATYDQSRQACCGGSAVFELSTHGCCGGKTYEFGKQGCCNEQTVFSLSDARGCVPGGVGGDETPTAGGANASGAVSAAVAAYACHAQWPMAAVRQAWSTYCGASSRKVWAMDHKCTQAWYTTKSSTDAAKRHAIRKCERRGGEKCFVFDADGSVCDRTAHAAQMRDCAGKAYDISSHGCCAGAIYEYGTHDCCGGKKVFRRSSQGCCAGKVFNSAAHGCCGGKTLYRTGTHGCCIDQGIQIYRMGRQQCCSGSGICTIQQGKYSCC